jgi:hypothetical protein
MTTQRTMTRGCEETMGQQPLIAPPDLPGDRSTGFAALTDLSSAILISVSSSLLVVLSITVHIAWIATQ